MSEASSIVLHTFALSHFCENVRWALDYKRVPYREESWAPVLHVFRTWRFEKRYTPVLRVEGKVLQESEDICSFLERRFPEPSLVPADHAEEVRAVADEARAIGADVRRLAYHALGQDRECLRAAWACNVGPKEARLHALVFPASRRLVYRRLGVDEASARKSQDRVRAFLDEWGARAGGRAEPLVADCFTLADLTMASILSPLARPPEHPFYRRMKLGEAFDQMVGSYSEDAMIRWVHAQYAQHRSPSCGQISARLERPLNR